MRQQSLLNPDKATFDKSSPADVRVRIGRDPGELVAVSNLVKGTDYTVEGSVVTLKKEYLAAQPVGHAVLDFRFRGDYRDDVHSASANGAAINFTFQGNGVEWITAVGPDQGEADVYVDGKLVRRVDLHGESRVTARQVFATGSKDGQHTLRIVKISGEVLRHDTVRYTIARRP